MQKLQLYISGERIDLFKDETVSINMSIQNVKDPAKIFTEFTKSFTVPASKTNNKIFKHYYNYNISGGFDARNKVSSLIELNNTTFKKGFITLTSVELKSNKATAYKIVFYGETVSIKNLLSDFKLAKLTQLNNYNLSYDATNISARLQTTASSGAILCPLITSGASNEDSDLNPLPSRLYYNSQVFTVADGNLHYHSGSVANGVLFSDLKYALRIHEIVLAITAEFPTLVFSDDFFNTSNAEYYNLYMWLHRKKGSVQEDVQVLSNPTPVIGFNDSVGFEPPFTQMQFFSQLTINQAYLPTVNVTLKLTTTSSEAYTVVLYRNGTGYANIANLTGTQTLDENDFGADLIAGTYTITIFSTTAFSFSDIEWSLSGFNLNQGGSGAWTETYNTGTLNITATYEFVITQQIPDMKIIEFLTSIFNMFNLTAYFDDRPILANGNTNPNFQKIRVQKLEDFYANNVQTYDISEFVDIDSSTVNVALPYREISFSYEDTDTFLAKQYNQVFGKVWGAESFTGDDTTNGDNFDGSSQKYSIQIPQSHVMFERLIDVNTNLTIANNQTSIQWGYFVDDNQDAYLGKPLMFYPIHQAAGSDTTPISFKTTNDLKIQITNYFLPSNSLSLNPSTSTKNLNFFPENNEFATGSDANAFTGTLFNETYRTYIRDIFKEKRRLINFKAYLPLNVIYNINMNDVFTINGASFNINTIKINLITGESDLELLNKL